MSQPFPIYEPDPVADRERDLLTLEHAELVRLVEA